MAPFTFSPFNRPVTQSSRCVQLGPLGWATAPRKNPIPASSTPFWVRGLPADPPSANPRTRSGALSRHWHRHIWVEKLAAGIGASHILQHHSGRLSVDAQVVKLKLSGCTAERAPSRDRPRNHAQ